MKRIRSTDGLDVDLKLICRVRSIRKQTLEELRIKAEQGL